jgi:hypothetical protein
MISMRRAGIIAIILILMILFAGCGQRVPTRNTTAKNPWGNTTTTPRGTGGSTIETPVVPTTTSPIIQVTLIPEKTVTTTPVGVIRSPPPVANATANLTLIDEKNMVFSYNKTAYNLELQDPPLLIVYTLTVPNITRIGVEKDPTVIPTADNPNPTRAVTKTYPDPAAWFEVSAMDLKTKHVIARDGYGRQYDVSVSKQVWVRYPGSYYIEFAGNRLTADVKFWVPNATRPTEVM